MEKKHKSYMKYMIYMCLIQASKVRYACDNKKDHMVKSLASPNDHASFYVFFDHPGPNGNILSFLLPLFQEGQLSVTGESMCMKYWLTA